MDSCVVERVFEGLALGCVVLSDNPTARDITNGIVEFVETEDDVVNKINYFKSNSEARLEKQLI